ncbi:MAG: nickel pincer cofactor biosynthesis protein LarC [Filifactoraceae bacterium]
MDLYLDMVGGIAGDMLISSLLAVNIISKDEFVDEMNNLLIRDEFKIEISDMLKGSIGGLHTKVIHGESHHHRHLADVIDIIKFSKFPEVVKENSIGVFTKLAEAEAKVHQSNINSVHFHEVGAVDSIVDVVGVCSLLHKLNIKRIYCSNLPISEGFVETEHGKMPLPAPATLELIKGMKTYFVDCKKETITPTGAAILKYFGAEFTKPKMNIEAIGIGCGSMEFDYPNILRAIIFKDDSLSKGIVTEELYLLSANIDDMTPEELAYSVEVIRRYSLDVDIEYIMMKKNRPAFKVNVLCNMEMKQLVLETMFNETSTIGIKEEVIQRHTLRHELIKRNTSYGEMTYKRAYMNGQVLKEKAEFDVRADLAKKNNKNILDMRL